VSGSNASAKSVSLKTIRKVREKMRHSRIALAIVAVIAASPAFATTNLVTNGDFTDLTKGLGQITNLNAQSLNTNVTSAVGWTTSGYNQVIAVADQAVNTQYGKGNFALWDQANAKNGWNGKAPVGNILALDGDYYTGPVWQTLTGLTAGEKYVVAFTYAFAQQQSFNGATIQSLTVNVGENIWNTSATTTTPSYNLPSKGFSGWSDGKLEFTANGSSEVLSFLAHGNVPVPPFALVSDVSVTASVPEPSTWALMLVGFVGLAYAGRRSSRRQAVAVA
jgi:hypothetical protein